MKALITGISGQDGSYLAELLLKKGYDVCGLVRRHSDARSQTVRLEHIRSRITLYYADVTDCGSINRIVSEVQPDEIYHLAAQSHIKHGEEMPGYTVSTIVQGTLNVLESVKLFCPSCKVYNAASSEMFGNNSDDDGYQRETTSFSPTSLYACAKACAHYLCSAYHSSFGLFVCSGILFNHESPRRGLTFVTNKVVKGAVDIALGNKQKLVLGNLDACRDWGHAKDYVRAMWMMLQQSEPRGYVVATGETRSVGDLVNVVFGKLGLDVSEYVQLDPKFCRSGEVWRLRGDSSLIKAELGWEKEISFDHMVDEMIEYWKQEGK